MKKIKYILLLLITSTLFANTTIIEKNGLKYFSDVIIIKYKTAQLGLGKGVLSKTLSKQFATFGISETIKYFHTKDKSEDIAINKIYRLKISSPFDPIYVSSKLAKHSEIEWAEPLYLREITHTPNDPKLSNQYWITNVKAEAAWNISKGNSNIIVAIIDSGVDWNHEDLATHIWKNEDEVLDGNDTDGNGFIDDIRGWDFGGLNGTGDNNPVEDSPTHGTHVAGIASAVTNNSVGVAGLGYSLTIMPVKASRHDLSDRVITYGYEGIIYAADNGADIINCSWGGFGYSIAEQEAINYAVSKGAVVVGAAGNDGLNDVIFPAAYKGVLSVGNTNKNDIKSSSSNYGKNIDVMAPGSGIYSTWQSSSTPYRTLSGTSMASPLVAGLVGLVIDKFPNYTPLQIIEQIRVNTDNIYNLNAGKENLLGSGRINAYKALSNSNVKSVRIVSSKFVETNNPNGIIEAGEEVEIKINFMNYLNSLTAFTAVLTTQSNQVTITQSQFSTTAKGTLEEFNNSNNTFKFKINNYSANDKEVLFKLTYSDGSYSDFELISVLINPTYRTQSGNNISFTITSKGTLAFNDYPQNKQGDGFTFMKGKNLLFEAGLMYGISETKLVNSVRDSNPDKQSNDFYPLSFVQIKNNGTIADQEGVSIFNDNNAGSQKLNIETELRTYSFSEAGNSNYIILKYIFRNKSGVDYSNFYSGIFFDWDIDEDGYKQNITKFDAQNNFGYVYHTAPDKPFIGMALLTNGNTGFYGITNDGSDGDIGIYKGISDAQKWKTLTNGLSKTDAGPKDVSSVISAGPFEIKANSTLVVAFSLSAGIDLNSLQNSVANSRSKYNSILTGVLDKEVKLPTKFSLSQNYPNPFNPSTTIEYVIPSVQTPLSEGVGLVTLKIYNMLGQEVATLVNKEQKPGRYKVTFNALPKSSTTLQLSSGTYIYRIVAYASTGTATFVESKKMTLLK